MSEIIPAIVPQSFEDLEEKLSIISGRVAMVHIDATNSSLTPESTWPYKENSKEFEMIKNEEEGFPFWENLNFEAHLMMKEPELHIEDWIRMGAERIIVQAEGFSSEEVLMKTLHEFRNRFDISNTYVGTEIGLGVNLQTPIDQILKFVLETDFIHLMSISEIGEQGHPFQSHELEKIKELKEKFPDTIISVDGGVTIPIAEELIEMGVDRIIVGSAIFASDDPEEALEDFIFLNQG
jgi:ribulose-phosphate 3-epimerase